MNCEECCRRLEPGRGLRLAAEVYDGAGLGGHLVAQVCGPDCGGEVPAAAGD